MTVLKRLGVLVPLLLGLSACQVTRMPDGTVSLNGGRCSYGSTSGPDTVHMRTPYPKVLGLNFTTDGDARTVAALLVKAYDTQGGISGVAAGVERCYAFAQADVERASSWPSEWRFCTLYDGVAYRIDNTRVRTYGQPRTPYFDPRLAGRRWESHIIDAGQGRRSELDAFMMKGAAQAAKYLPIRVFGLRE